MLPLYRTRLTGDAQAYKTIRSALVDKHCMQAVITMPSGVFQPYSGVSTAIIIFTKTGTGGTDKVWFYDMRADGFSLTTQRTPQPEQNDIPDISPVSITSKRKPTAVAKNSHFLSLPMKFVPMATISAISVTTKWNVRLLNMKHRKLLSPV